MYKVRSVKFSMPFTFDDKYDNCSEISNDEIIEEAKRQLNYMLEFNDLSANDFDVSFEVEYFEE